MCPSQSQPGLVLDQSKQIIVMFYRFDPRIPWFERAYDLIDQMWISSLDLDIISQYLVSVNASNK